MKPKLTALTTEVKCENILFDDIPSILIAPLTKDIEVFDATHYCEVEKIETPDYAVFHNNCLRYIDPILKTNELPSTMLYYKNTDEHLLINTMILLVFMQFATPDITVYFNQIVGNCLMNGMVFSDSFVMRLAVSQIPDEGLQQIIKFRHEQKQQP